MKITCPNPKCLQSIEIEREHAGAVANCPTCEQEMQLPDLSAFPAVLVETHEPLRTPSAKTQHSSSPSARQPVVYAAPAKRNAIRLPLVGVVVALIAAVVAGGFHFTRRPATEKEMPASGSSATALASSPTNQDAISGGGSPTVEKGIVTGTVVAWGNNNTGQTDVPAGLSGVTTVAASIGHTVALKKDGTVVAWGGARGLSVVPSGLRGVIAIAAGWVHTVALKKDGMIAAWWSNEERVMQLSQGGGLGMSLRIPDSGQTNVPAGLTGVTAIAAGGGHTVALNTDGTVAAWGSNHEGQCNVPPGLTGVIAIAAGTGHTVALKDDRTVVAWGGNKAGQTNVPVGLSGVATIAAGMGHTVALKDDGTVIAWGDNERGQSVVPAGLSGVIAIAAGGVHTVALKKDGTVVAWGGNQEGQIAVPAGLSGVIAIAAGGFHTVALIAEKSPSVPPSKTMDPLPDASERYLCEVDRVGGGATVTFLADGSLNIVFKQTGGKVSTLTFSEPCELTVMQKDKTLLASKAGLTATDDKGKQWRSQNVTLDGKAVFAFFPKATGAPAPQGADASTPYQWRGPDAAVPVSAEGIIVKDVVGKDGKAYTEMGGAPGGAGMIPSVGNKYPIDNPGSKDIRIEIDPAVKSTGYAGLTFTTPCVVEILQDGTLLADKEGVQARDAKGKEWVSRRHTIHGKEASAFFQTQGNSN